MSDDKIGLRPGAGVFSLLGTCGKRIPGLSTSLVDTMFFCPRFPPRIVTPSLVQLFLHGSCIWHSFLYVFSVGGMFYVSAHMLLRQCVGGGGTSFSLVLLVFSFEVFLHTRIHVRSFSSSSSSLPLEGSGRGFALSPSSSVGMVSNALLLTSSRLQVECFKERLFPL